MESEKTQKKKFHLVDNAYLDSYEATKNDSELMAQIFGEQQNMFSDIVEYIVYAIDSYEEDVDEVDTQDPLFGLYQEVEDIDNE